MNVTFTSGGLNGTHLLAVEMNDREACVLLGIAEGVVRAMRGEEPPPEGSLVAAPKLGPCDHKFMASGQHVEGVKSAVVETCVLCGATR